MLVAKLDTMSPLDRSITHLIRDCMVAIAGQTVHASPHEKVSIQFCSCAKQLVNITLAVPDMDASTRVTEQLRGLPQILKPSKALFLLDRNPGRIDLPLQGIAA